MMNLQNLTQAPDNPVSSAGVRPRNFQAARADVTRQQWADFKQRYLPVQRRLLALASNNDLLNAQLDRNQSNLATAFSRSAENESMRMGRYGLAASQAPQQHTNRQLLKDLTLASVNNETRSAVDELQNKILTGQGGAPKTLADISRG